MNSRIVLFILCIMVSIFMYSCLAGDEQEHSKKVLSHNEIAKNQNNLNVSILLDLSDRISPEKNANPSMQFYERDLGYIESIAQGFESHLRSKPIRNDNDQIQIYFEPEPLNPAINNLAKKLKLSFTKDNVTKANIVQILPQYKSISREIYKLSISNKKYIGSDIWKFFKNKARDYCIEPGHRNILFVLTDGYMFHEDSKFMQGNKSSYITPSLIASLKLNTPDYKELIQKKGYGFLKANDNLNALEVVVLGINPAKGNPFESDVINNYWVSWLKSMKVKGPIMEPATADLPSNLDPIIQKYINP